MHDGLAGHEVGRDDGGGGAVVGRDDAHDAARHRHLEHVAVDVDELLAIKELPRLEGAGHDVVADELHARTASALDATWHYNRAAQRKRARRAPS